MINSVVVDETTLRIQNLFTNKGVLLGAEDIQNICNYAIKNGLVKLEMAQNNNNAGDIYSLESENKLVVNFAKEHKTIVVRSLSKEEREKNLEKEGA